MKEPVSRLRRTAFEVRNYRLWIKILSLILLMAIIIVAIVYLFSILYEKRGSFTVTAEKRSTIEGLALSTDRNFNYKTSRLDTDAARELTNIDGRSIPLNLDSLEGGDHSNPHYYLAYTFFCKNCGEETVSYRYDLTIWNITQGIDDAIRVRLYTDGDYIDYARPNTKNGQEEPNTTIFTSKGLITSGTITGFSPNDITRYTVVIWLEGNDPECIDSILGGKFAVNMTLTITAKEATEEN